MTIILKLEQGKELYDLNYNTTCHNFLVRHRELLLKVTLHTGDHMQIRSELNLF